MIEVQGLTRRYGDKTVVDDLTFAVQPGVVTGFLGPNGAGKSTTMRMLLGLETPDAGHATVNGREYRTLGAPAHEIGVLLDAGARHPGRSARDHLLSLAATHRIPVKRVDEVLDLVGLSEVARQRSGAFSLGMGQRLGIAAALLGDPGNDHAGRTGQRSGPGGHPVDPRIAARVGRAGAHGVRLLPPHE